MTIQNRSRPSGRAVLIPVGVALFTASLATAQVTISTTSPMASPGNAAMSPSPIAVNWARKMSM